jgi:hypothetical protein
MFVDFAIAGQLWASQIVVSEQNADRFADFGGRSLHRELSGYVVPAEQSLQIQIGHWSHYGCSVLFQAHESAGPDKAVVGAACSAMIREWRSTFARS